MNKIKGVRVQTCILSAMIIAMVLSGCATKIPITMLKPGNYHQAATAKTVAVLPFSGSEGESFASEIESVLAGVQLKDQPYFTLVDRAQIDKVLSELKFSQSALVDQEKAVQAGRMMGAQGIYTGIAISKTSESPYKEKRSECVRHQIKRDKDGNEYQGNCIQYRNRYVQCTKRVSSFSTTPKLIAVNSGRILYSKTLTRQENSSGCEDETPAKEPAELIEKAKEFIKAEFRKDIAPYYETVMIKLLDSTDNIDSKEAKELLQSGIDFAGKSRLDTACEKWGQAKQMAPNSASLAYNLAVCSEATADYASALKLYKEAERLQGKSEENITLGITRASAGVKNQKKLDEQLKE